jgi:DNA helicase-2/ATP-dependent DNA helicase PcrA
MPPATPRSPGRPPDPERLLADLDPEQREAVTATTGPVAILAGAGTGKTRVISRRAAYAIATGVVPADEVLVVTFTDKAAGEMVERLRDLGLAGVTARTFHAHALSQLRHFWPSRHDGAPLPALLDSKAPILGRLARQLPGHYRFTPAKDLADEIEWAKSRRITPRSYEREAVEAGHRDPPIPVDLFVNVFAGYERAKARAGRIDFDDLLVGAIDLLEADADAAATVRARKRWFSVDEYQDTNPLQQRLLELWVGDRPDLCVVGDEDQTIYSFTGASSGFLTSFAERHAGARLLTLTRNYRSTPQVLELANRLVAADGRAKRLTSSCPDGPTPVVLRYVDGEAELAAIVRRMIELVAAGTAPNEIAVLVRMNAQLPPLEEALTRARVAYQVRGLRFYERPEVTAAIALLRRRPGPASGVHGPALAGAVRVAWRDELGHDPDADVDGAEARERAAALDTLLAILDELVRGDPTTDVRSYLTDLDARAAHERDGSAEGVNLLTYHRAKGLEWDAVFLPMLEEGTLPIRHAFDDDDALAEERRLLYVGITRARTHLCLSWAERRESRGRAVRRHASRFLAALAPRRPASRPGRTFRRAVTADLPPPATELRVVQLPDGFAAPEPRAARPGEVGDPCFAALREWRAVTARAEDVPAYVIAHDATLAAIAEARPRTLPGLRRVKGMGPAKLEKYGAEILAIIERACRPPAD